MSTRFVEWITLALVVVLAFGLVGFSGVVGASAGDEAPTAETNPLTSDSMTQISQNPPTERVVVTTGEVSFPVSDEESFEDGPDDDDFDRITFRIEVFENGDARWTTANWKSLENETERDDFQTFIDRFEDESTAQFDAFVARAEALTDAGTDATGRQMEATSFERSGTIDPLNRGVIEMSFVWTNFAVVEDEDVFVGDVFEGGWYIFEDQRLEITAGGNLSISSVEDPPPDAGSVDENSVRWFGPTEFGDSEPSVTFTSVAEDPSNDTDNGDTDDEEGANLEDENEGEADDGTDLTDETGVGMFAVVFLLFVVVAIGAGIAWYSGVIQRSSDETTTSSPDGDGSAAEAVSAESPAEPAVPQEPLSDEDRVVQLLEDNGGRMKQVNIVEETEWSKSKVSMLLSDMEEAGTISKLRVGRENIISLAGEEPEAAGSPFDDE